MLFVFEARGFRIGELALIAATCLAAACCVALTC
jgi:hypothetical protein